MFQMISPEAAGIRREAVEAFVNKLSGEEFDLHSLVLARGSGIFAEGYKKPFTADSLQRMYSQTKGLVSLGIGLLVQDGVLKLDDAVSAYFPDKLGKDIGPWAKEMTVREMLMMRTAVRCPDWHTDPERDRVKLYFSQPDFCPAGTVFSYDTDGSQVLGCLVERLSGRKLLDFLKDRLFNRMGIFQTARVLMCPGGSSWSDGGLLATQRDMLALGRFLLNRGRWNGEQLMDPAYLDAACSKLVDSNEHGIAGHQSTGYGYQIWQIARGGYALVGMGDQLTFCMPDKDLIFSCTADHQGNDLAHGRLFDSFFTMIYDLMDEPAADTGLGPVSFGGELRAIAGSAHMPLEKKVSGVKYYCPENRMGIREFTLTFEEDAVNFHYVNAQGVKNMRLGLGKNLLGKFPEYGYPRLVGGEKSIARYLYDAAFSAAWRDEEQLMLRVQIIDMYLGNLTAIFSFKDEYCSLVMRSNADHFLEEYRGVLVAKAGSSITRQ